MLYVVDKVMKLGGVYIGGEVTDVEITEGATIYEAQDDKGKIKSRQPNVLSDKLNDASSVRLFHADFSS